MPSVSFLRANVVSAFIGAPILAGITGADWLLWNRGADANAYNLSPWFAVAIIAGVLAHEFLHALGFWLVGGVPWQHIRISIYWRLLTPYATSAQPISIRAYRWTTALPALVLGVLPAAAGLAAGSWVLSAYGALMLAAASGDIMILWMTRAMAPTLMVRDHAHRAGCEVVG